MKIKTVIFTLLVMLSMQSAHGATLNPEVAREAWVTVAMVEKENGIPRGLLHSISLVESGKGLSGQILPWPYTAGVNRSKKYEFTSTAAATGRLNALSSLGFSKFEVSINGRTSKNLSKATVAAKLNQADGQKISLRGQNFAKRFGSKEEATRYVEKLIRNGITNIDIGMMQVNWMYHGQNFASVADAFDTRKNAAYAVSYLKQHKQTRDWWNSVGRYHSGTAEHAKRYIKSVWAMYKRIHRIDEETNVAQAKTNSHNS